MPGMKQAGKKEQNVTRCTQRHHVEFLFPSGRTGEGWKKCDGGKRGPSLQQTDPQHVGCVQYAGEK